MDLLLRNFPLEYLHYLSSDAAKVGKVLCTSNEDELRLRIVAVTRVLSSMNQNELRTVLENMIDTMNFFGVDEYRFIPEEEARKYTLKWVRVEESTTSEYHPKIFFYDDSFVLDEKTHVGKLLYPIISKIMQSGFLDVDALVEWRRLIFNDDGVTQYKSGRDSSKSGWYIVGLSPRHYFSPLISLMGWDRLLSLFNERYRKKPTEGIGANIKYLAVWYARCDEIQHDENKMLSHPTYRNCWIEWSEKRVGFKFGTIPVGHPDSGGSFITESCESVHLVWRTSKYYPASSAEEQQIEDRSSSDIVSMHSCKVKTSIPANEGGGSRSKMELWGRFDFAFGFIVLGGLYDMIGNMFYCSWAPDQNGGFENHIYTWHDERWHVVCRRIARRQGIPIPGQSIGPKSIFERELCVAGSNSDSTATTTIPKKTIEETLFYDFICHSKHKGVQRCGTGISVVIRDAARSTWINSRVNVDTRVGVPANCNRRNIDIDDTLHQISSIIFRWMVLKGFLINADSQLALRTVRVRDVTDNNIDANDISLIGMDVNAFYGPFFQTPDGKNHVETNYFMDMETGIGWKQFRFFDMIAVPRRSEVTGDDLLKERDDFKARLSAEGYSQAVPKVLLNHAISEFCGEPNIGRDYDADAGEEGEDVDTDEEGDEELVDRFFPLEFARWLNVKADPEVDFRWKEAMETGKTWPTPDRLSWDTMDIEPDRANPWKNVPLLCRDLISCKRKKKYVQDQLLPDVVGPIKVGISYERLRKVLRCRIAVILSLLDAKSDEEDLVDERDVESLLRKWDPSKSGTFPRKINVGWEEKTFATETEQIENFKNYALSEDNLANLMSTRCDAPGQDVQNTWWTDEALKSLIYDILKNKIPVFGYPRPSSGWYYSICSPLRQWFTKI